jgi:UDP-N-acetylmuramoyl-tripeptide--D-alanyl-D-alanine ligase
MLNIKAKEVIEATGGLLKSGGSDFIVNNISLDTRTLKKGDFFIPLIGQNYDGHNFIIEAYNKKAIGCLCEETKFKDLLKKFKNNLPKDFSIIVVEDTLRSLGYIAGLYRNRFKIKAIAITGSNGKTTTKELVYNLLLTKYKREEVLVTEKNFNNEVGVPQTIFKLNNKVKIFLAELGINHIGEMQRLARMVSPDIGLITNIGDTHLEFLKNNKIVAKAKGEMIPFIKDKLILNFDDTFYNYFLNITDKPVKSFSLNTAIPLEEVVHFDSYKDLGIEGFEISYKGLNFRFKLVGEHNLYNLLAALSVAEEFGISIKDCKEVIENFKPVEYRGEVIKRKDYIIYFDAYNANPSSSRALLYFLSNLNYRFKLAILGDMMELGKKAMKYHTEVLQYADNLNIDLILTYGNIYRRVRKERNVNKDKIESYTELEKIGKRVNELAEKYKGEMIIVVKGSRKMEMERLLKFI